MKAWLQHAWTAAKSVLRVIDQWAARRAFYWTKVRAISNTSAARTVILVPLIGYWIILNNWFVEKLTRLSPQIVGAMAVRTP